MKIKIQITIDLDLIHGMSTQNKIATTIKEVGVLVDKCGQFSKVEHALFFTEDGKGERQWQQEY